MTHRDRFVSTVLGKPVDRPPFWLYWPPWETTWKAWSCDGMPSDLKSFKAVRTLFNADALPKEVPIQIGPCPFRKRRVLEETESTVIYVDNWGVKRRELKQSESMPEFLEAPIKDWDDWRKFKAERLDPGHPDRLGKNWREYCAEWTAQGYPLQLGCYPDSGIFGGLRWLMGDEECLIAFYTMPDLVHDIMNHLTTVFLTVFEKVAGEFPVDVIHLWEDICFKNGPFISPGHFNEFMAPCYKRISAFARKYGIPVISVDTDGNPDLLIPHMMECGVNLIYPLEVTAGVDVNSVIEKYPGLAVMGGIDKRCLAKGPEAIDREMERIRPAFKKGRYIPDLDHLVPDNVSWENFRYYALALKKLVGIPA